MTEVALAIDVGGTELRAALVDDGGEILAFAAAPTLASGGPEAIVGQIETLAAEVRAAAPGQAVTGIGVCAPGPLDPVAAIVIAPPTLSGWSEVPLAAILRDRLNLPVRLENDANAAALGEWRYGAGRGAQSLVFVTVSTGIGGGVVVDGHILHGRRGLAAEIGHMTITGESAPCFCGAMGCFEAVASGTALGRRATARTAPGDGSVLRRLSGDGEVSGRQVVDAGRLHDPLALALLEEEARWLGIGFTNLLHLFSPDVIVVGGGIANGLDLMRPAIEATVLARAMSAYRAVPIVPARLGRHAGLVGAASLMFRTGKAPAAPTATKKGARKRADARRIVNG